MSIAASNSARKTDTGVIVSRESRQASFAPAMTVTNCGFFRTACAIWPFSSAIRDPVTAKFQLRWAAPVNPSNRTARLLTDASLPVAQDASGQSVSTMQESKPRVMESPTAAIESGLVFQTGGGAADGREAPVPASSPTALQPAVASTAAATTA
ncbi:hypothetical protein TNCT6_43110 [Streptomyces sp. 6-11-2]|nr:hypothetical protein TNCT6_43110 [Streptomyces sp. 6-11-2]